MKPIILPLLLLLYQSIPAQQIPKNANTIIITDTLSQEQFYNKITNILFESGYGILSSDIASGTITTTPKPIKSGTVKLNILIKDKKVSIRGEFRGPPIDFGGVIADAPSIIEYYGMKRSPAMQAWNEMNSIVTQIPGKKEYLVK